MAFYLLGNRRPPPAAPRSPLASLGSTRPRPHINVVVLVDAVQLKGGACARRRSAPPVRSGGKGMRPAPESCQNSVLRDRCIVGRVCVRVCVCVCVCMCVWTNQQGGCRPAWRREAAVREKTREETQTRQPHILSLVSLSPSLSPSLSLSLSFLACSFSVLAIGPNRLRLLQGSREADWRSSPSASSHLLASSARLFSALASFDSPAFPIARCSQTRARP